MATILFTWELGGGTGHVVNLLPFVRWFADRGDDVYVALRDVTTGAGFLTGINVSILPAPALRESVRYPVRPARTFAHILHNTGFGTDSELASLTNSWRNLFALIGPDLVVFEHSPSALLASRGCAVKRAIVGTGFFAPPDVYPLPDLRSWMQPMATQLRQDEDVVHDRVCRQLARWGEPPIERLSKLYQDVDGNYLLTFKELDHYTGRESAAYTGMPQLDGGQKPSWPRGDGPRVFAYLRRSPLLRPLLKSLRARRIPTLAYLVDCDPDTRARHASETIRISNQRLDMVLVARECDMAIMNGNAGTAIALLLEGKPSLHLPVHLEQTLFSMRVEQLGAGLLCTIDQREVLEASLDQMLSNERFASSAREFAGKYRTYDPGASMADIAIQLERLVERA